MSCKVGIALDKAVDEPGCMGGRRGTADLAAMLQLRVSCWQAGCLLWPQKTLSDREVHVDKKMLHGICTQAQARALHHANLEGLT